MNLEVFAWVVAGLLTGWLAGIAMRDGGYGRIWDVILGLGGSGAISTFASAVGAPSEIGRVAMIVAAFVGAALLIVAQRKIWPALAGDDRERWTPHPAGLEPRSTTADGIRRAA